MLSALMIYSYHSKLFYFLNTIALKRVSLKPLPNQDTDKGKSTSSEKGDHMVLQLVIQESHYTFLPFPPSVWFISNPISQWFVTLMITKKKNDLLL